MALSKLKFQSFVLGMLRSKIPICSYRKNRYRFPDSFSVIDLETFPPPYLFHIYFLQVCKKHICTAVQHSLCKSVSLHPNKQSYADLYQLRHQLKMVINFVVGFDFRVPPFPRICVMRSLMQSMDKHTMPFLLRSCAGLCYI